MNQFIKAYWKPIVFFTIVGLLGGFFTGLYLLDSYPADIRQQLIDELSSRGLGQTPVNLFIAVVTALQSAGYGLVLGAVGILLGKKTGLWKDERSIAKKPLAVTLVVSLMGGLALILPDLFFFGQYSQAIMDSYATKPSIPYLLQL